MYPIVTEEEGQPGKYVLSGILDFGDVHINFYLFELAIAICYMMIECQSMNILDAPGHVLAGYNRFRLIPENEFTLLKVLRKEKLNRNNHQTSSNGSWFTGLYCSKIKSIPCFGCLFLFTKPGSLSVNYVSKRLAMPQDALGLSKR